MAVRSRTRTPATLSGQGFYDYVTRRAVSYGLDPTAVLAVASQEGLGGGVGDQGTSFGPWQLHAGGALPRSVWLHGPAYAQAWAWSPAGIDYALRKMAASGASNLSGSSAIETIVSRFERPAKPGPEIIAAEAAYGGPQGPFARTRPDIPGGSAGGGGGGLGAAISGATDAVSDTLEGAWKGSLGVISGPADFLRMALWLVEPKQWLRAVEFVAGAGLMVLSLRALFFLYLERGTGIGAAVQGLAAARSGGATRALSSRGGPPDELAAARTRTETERTKEIRARRRQRLEQSRSLRRERDQRERAAYYRGAADAGR